MVLHEKVRQNRHVACYKTRLVPYRVRQQPGIYFANTYSRTILQVAIRAVLSKAVVEDKQITQLDIVTIFLESRIEEELYLKQLKHFTMAKNM